MDRFIPLQRTTIDGKTWWCIYDTKRHEWSRYICHFYMFKTKKRAQANIDYYNKEWRLEA